MLPPSIPNASADTGPRKTENQPPNSVCVESRYGERWTMEQATSWLRAWLPQLISGRVRSAPAFFVDAGDGHRVEVVLRRA